MASRQENNISPKAGEVRYLYKALGETPLDSLERFKAENPKHKDTKMTYAGRLDPMAEGLLCVLLGSEVNLKEKYLAESKTYVFKIFWGFETDTADLLGKVVSGKAQGAGENPEIGEIEKILQNLKGKFEQKYPAYSSKPVNGKPLFMWAREGKINEIEIPFHEVQVFESKFLGRESISSQKLLGNILENFSKVKGDFRQEEIKNDWKDVLGGAEKNYFIDTCMVKVSSGFYIRQFVLDLAEALGTKATTFHIKRTAIGDNVL